MASVFAYAVNLQRDCPLFSKIPQELRDKIFDLVVTPHDEKHFPYPEALRYSRPGFRHSDRNLSITLLRCCQLIYSQTRDLPAKKYVQVDWICGGKDGHNYDDDNRFKRVLPKELRNLHLFTRRFWLHSGISKIWAPYTRFVATQAPNLTNLKITLEHDTSLLALLRPHNDIVPNPKNDSRGLKYTEDSDSFEEWSWGYPLQNFKSLTLMELEVETLEEQTEKLDLVLAKAAGWRFPLASGKELVFNARKTKWEGWHGPSLDPGEEMTAPTGASNVIDLDPWPTPVPGFHKDPIAARKRLIEAGVDFKIAEDGHEYTDDDCETYCVATLVFEAT